MTTHPTSAGSRRLASFTCMLMVAAFLAAPHVRAQSLAPSSLELLQDPGSIDPGFFALLGAGTNGEAIGTYTQSGQFTPSSIVAIGRDGAREIAANGAELVDAAGVALGAVTRLLDVQMLSDGSAVVNAVVGGNRVMLRFVGGEVEQLPISETFDELVPFGRAVGSQSRRFWLQRLSKPFGGLVNDMRLIYTDGFTAIQDVTIPQFRRLPNPNGFEIDVESRAVGGGEAGVLVLEVRKELVPDPEIEDNVSANQNTQRLFVVGSGGERSVLDAEATFFPNLEAAGISLGPVGINDRGQVLVARTDFGARSPNTQRTITFLRLEPDGTVAQLFNDATATSLGNIRLEGILANGVAVATAGPPNARRALLGIPGESRVLLGPGSEFGELTVANVFSSSFNPTSPRIAGNFIAIPFTATSGSSQTYIAMAQIDDSREYTWTADFGGEWGDASNWNPPEVPDHGTERSDTAVFSLSGQYPINATGARAGRMIVRNGIVDILGDAQLFASSLDAPSLLVGDNGILNVIGGTFLTVNSALGESSAGTSEVAVLNQGTRWENNGRLLVGDAGPGKLSVVNGFASALETRVGGGALAGGDVVVGGATGRWDPGSLAVGFAGPGRLEIRDGGTVVSDTLLIGRAGAGEVLINGAEMSSRDLFIGENAEGTLRLEHGALLGSGDVIIGAGGSGGLGRGEVVVDGGGQAELQATSWLVGGLTVGGQAPGQLQILDGGRVTALEQVFVGQSAAERFDFQPDGSILVRGGTPGLDPSRFFALSEVMLGLATNAIADVKVLDGGEIVVSEDLYVGFEAGAFGTLRVGGVNAFGARSRVQIGSDDPDPETGITCRVGYHGVGAIIIEAGGIFSCPNLLIGGLEGSLAEVRVVGRAGGVRSELRVTGDRFAVGGVTGLGSLDGVPGTLELNDGLVVTPGELWIGEQGVVRGQGIIQAHTIVANGYLAPAFFPTVSAAAARPRLANETETPRSGVLTLDGDLVLGPTGVIAVEIGGPESDNQTLLDVLGTAALNGRLELNFRNGHAPRQGDQLRFLAAAGGLSGGFDDVRTSGLAPGFEYELDTAGGEVRLTALNDAVAAAPPRFDPLPFVTAGGLQLSIDAPAEQEVVIFAAPGVLLPAQPVHTNSGSFFFVDPIPSGEGQRFYRAVGR